MNRSAFCPLLVACALCPFRAMAADQPNIIFFLADDQRHDALGCAGHPIIRSPHIDALAAQGVRFRNAYVSHSICWVSRTTILTGLTARSFGSPATPDHARSDALEALYPDLLRQAGYRTGFFGKWHAKTPPGFRPETHFDQFERISRNPYFKQQEDGTKRHETELIADRAIKFLADQSADQPFCLNLWFNAAHAEDGDKRPGSGHYPWPQAVDGLYDNVAMPPPRLNDPAIFANQPEHLQQSINRERFFWRWDTPEKYDANMRAYFRMISGIDHAIGRVVEAVRERGLAKNTIIVYSADNGYYMGDRGFAGKWSHYEQSLRVPLIVFDPRLPASQRGRVDESLALNLDFPSTFLDWASVEIPASYQGRSLKGLVDGTSNQDWRTDFFCEHVTLAPHITWEGVHGQRYVYARYFDQDPVYEFLHDLQTDPDQLKNLAKVPDHANQLAALRRRCDELVKKYGGALAPLSPRGPRQPYRKAKLRRPVDSQPNAPEVRTSTSADQRTGAEKAAADVVRPPGFVVERLYVVPKDQQGSWVALTKDPLGRLIACDEGEKGLYRITVSDDRGEPTVEVEKIPVDVTSAQGLLWARDSLYAHINGSRFVRIYDANGDDQLDAIEELPAAKGGGEHGNHGIILAEDKQLMYVASGNHTDVPPLCSSRLTTWEEDLLLPRMWDARGHARGRLAPGGHISRFDPESKTYELYCSGFRNEYDIALNRHGELFTFDADMEWDQGAPWYRPTRICHVVSGGEFGWRSGTGKWPVYYEDSLPAAVDIGPGSPTGIVSGAGTNFPGKYRDALYALDWTFGTIYAIHLKEDGASYRADAEHFVWGTPLPVTDAIVGNDGALYFTVGGRGADSALYRVTWTGEETAAHQRAPDDPDAAAARQLRRRLESFHGRRDDQAVDVAWPYLGHADRFLRYAARLAVESQPVDEWADRAVQRQSPQASLTAAVALARMGTGVHQPKLLAALGRFQVTELSKSHLLSLLRAYALTFSRLGYPTESERAVVLGQLDPLLPHHDDDVNTELIRVLSYLRAPRVVEKSLQLIAERSPPVLPDWAEVIQRNAQYGGTIRAMLDNPPPAREIGYALMLRNIRHGWTLQQRQQYFQFINEAAKGSGGASFPGFLKNIRDEALANCDSEQRAKLTDITGEDFNPTPQFDIEPINGPGQRWTRADLLPLTEKRTLRKADFERGRSLYFAATCGKCHRFMGLGGGVGPDLTSVRNKFDASYLVEAMLEPSKVISDQYASSIVQLSGGKSLTGLVVEESDQIIVYTSDPHAEPIVGPRDQVVEIKRSDVSQMPTGLLDSLNRDEVRDLLAYLLSGGNPEDRVYGKKKKK